MAYIDNRVTGMVGTTGTGKTTIQIELIKKFIEYNPHGVIYGYDPHRLLKKYIGIPIYRENLRWAIELDNVRDSLIILDDYVGLMDSKKGNQQYIPVAGMTRMFSQARFYNNQIIFACHSPKAIIPKLAEYTTHHILFKTNVDEESFDGRVQNAGVLIKSAKTVNAYCTMIGNKGYHPLHENYEKSGRQGFPHIVVDNVSEQTILVNMFRKHFQKAGAIIK